MLGKPCSRIPFLCYRLIEIPVPITALNQRAVPVRNAVNQTAAGLDVEAATSAHSHAPHMGASLLARTHYCLDPIPGLKPVNALGSG